MYALINIESVPVFVRERPGKHARANIWIAHLRRRRVFINCQLMILFEVLRHEFVAECFDALAHALVSKCEVLESEQTSQKDNIAIASRTKSNRLILREFLL